LIQSSIILTVICLQKKDTQLADLRSQLVDAQKFRDQSAAARAQIAMFTDNFRVREADLLARLETARNEGICIKKS
jgi:hypothetical protein